MNCQFCDLPINECKCTIEYAREKYQAERDDGMILLNKNQHLESKLKLEKESKVLYKEKLRRVGITVKSFLTIDTEDRRIKFTHPDDRESHEFRRHGDIVPEFPVSIERNKNVN
jgi:hypothetical protein